MLGKEVDKLMKTESLVNVIIPNFSTLKWFTVDGGLKIFDRFFHMQTVLHRVAERIQRTHEDAR